MGGFAFNANADILKEIIRDAFAKTIMTPSNAVPLADFFYKFKVKKSFFNDWCHVFVLDTHIFVEKSEEKKHHVKQWKMRHRGDKA